MFCSFVFEQRQRTCSNTCSSVFRVYVRMVYCVTGPARPPGPKNPEHPHASAHDARMDIALSYPPGHNAGMSCRSGGTRQNCNGLPAIELERTMKCATVLRRPLSQANRHLLGRRPRPPPMRRRRLPGQQSRRPLQTSKNCPQFPNGRRNSGPPPSFARIFPVPDRGPRAVSGRPGGGRGPVTPIE
jgi:hypothetical protein